MDMLDTFGCSVNFSEVKGTVGTCIPFLPGNFYPVFGTTSAETHTHT
jgi:hypothetical protein